MIKINLLPPEIAQKVARRRVVTVAGLAGGIIFGIAIAVFLLRFIANRSLAAKVQALERELQEYKKIAEEVQKYKGIAAKLEAKKSIIENLKKNSLIYPKFVEEFLSLVPPTVWFSAFNTQTTPEGLTLTVNCSSLDNFAIADFISNLESSQKFTGIEVSAISIAGEPGKETCSFSLKCNYKVAL